MSWYRYDNSGDLVLKLYVQPGAKTTEVTGLHADSLKIKLAAVPMDGKANEHLEKFLADRFKVSINKIKIKQGNKSRLKVLLIQESVLGPEVLYCEEINS